ncbi:MAG: trypsin-like peptidase domain-containing protein [Deltaproteobacteria bacterium]|nr:trypsin-like peptidase domain-containing protein [Deltaproteobacteria bacterium]
MGWFRRASRSSVLALLVAAGCATQPGPAGPPSTESRPRDGAYRWLPAARQLDAALAEVTARVLPSVVGVAAVRTFQRPPGTGNDEGPLGAAPGSSLHREAAAPGPPARERSVGSGVIVSREGLVLTSHHVVELATRVEVTLLDGRTFAATVVGTDPETDLALLRLRAPPPGLRPLPLGNSDRAALGGLVLTVGNAYGEGHAVGLGVIAARRHISLGAIADEEFLVTDAAITPGSSGGALVNLDGALLGLNAAFLSPGGGYQGIGFAVPSSTVAPILAGLLRRGRFVRGWLGAELRDLGGDRAALYGLPGGTGVEVASVATGGPAERAGLRAGDVLRSLGTQSTGTGRELRRALGRHEAGTTVAVELVRGGQTRSVRVRLAEAPPRTRPGLHLGEQDGPLGGFTIGELDTASRRQHQIPLAIRSGVVVLAVSSTGRGASSGLVPGDVLLALNGAPLASTARFGEVYRRSAGRFLLVLYYRNGSVVYTMLRP